MKHALLSPSTLSRFDLKNDSLLLLEDELLRIDETMNETLQLHIEDNDDAIHTLIDLMLHLCIDNMHKLDI